jgi:two-component system LytT family sensor kinase
MLSPFSQTRFRVIFSVSWLIILGDFAITLWSFGLPWWIAVADSAISGIVLLSFSLIIINTLRYYRPGGDKYFNIIVWCLLLTGLWILICKGILFLVIGNAGSFQSFFHRSAWIRTSTGFLLLGCITLISLNWFNAEEQRENDKRKADAEKLSKDAELFKLRQQLQPHFLFNSLNSINALIVSQPQEARKMIQQLSDFLRGTLKKEEHQRVSLREELQYLQLYLDIEKVRFANRLQTEINIAEGTEELFLPALLLQPIVENAIKFGLYDTTGETIIRLTSFLENKLLVIKVENPFDPETSSPRKGTGFGLSSVQRRLYLLFGRSDLLTTEAEKNIFVTTVKIPQHE